MSARVPQLGFLIIGAMKCGTTSLSRALKAHPAIFMPEREIHFFDHIERYLSVWRGGRLDADRLEAEYGRHFHSAKQLCGSKTPSYVASTACMERIQRFHPDAKLILMLRDPVERARSHWSHLQRAVAAGKVPNDAVAGNLLQHLLNDREELDGPRNLDGEVSSLNVLHRGCYAEQIRHVHRLFASDQLLVGFLSDLADAPDRFYPALFEFLEVSFSAAPLTVPVAARSPSPRYALARSERMLLIDFYAKRTAEIEELCGRRLPDWCR